VAFDVELVQVARDRIDRGWQKQGYGDWNLPNGDVCAVGALAYAAKMLRGNRYSDYEPAMMELARYSDYEPAMMELARFLPAGFTRIFEFNDHPDTTKQDVLDLFDKALADLGGLA
jgi:hypothetical protein